MRKIIIFIFLAAPLPLEDARAASFWSKLSFEQKKEAIHALKEFNLALNKDETYLISQTNSSSGWADIIAQAYASTGHNCFYGGWPSETVEYNNKTYCTSPKNKNSWYQEKYKNTCAETSLLCNPILFGEGLCVEGKTRKQRVYTYSNCEKLFKAKKRNLEDVIKKIDEDQELQQRFQDMLSTAKEVCSPSGFQGKTGMCRILMQRMNSLAKNISLKPVKEKKEKEDKAKTTEVEITNETLTKEVVEELTEINKDVKKINETVKKKAKCFEQIKIPEAEHTAEYWEMSEKIDQNKESPDNFCHGLAYGRDYETYSQTKYHSDHFAAALDLSYEGKLAEQDKIVSGFTIQANRYGKAYPYVEEREETDKLYYPQRTYGYSFPGRGKEALLTIIDSPIKEKYDSKGEVIDRYPSSDIKITNYMFFPRNVVPSVTQRNGKNYMTLTTGEKVIFDAKTGKVEYGAFLEEKSDNTVVRSNQKRFYPDTKFSYQGEGIWIEAKTTASIDEISTAGTLIPIRSNIGGKISTCKMKSEELFQITSGHYLDKSSPKYEQSKWSCNKFRFNTDEEFYAAIKKKCPDFKFPRLTE